MRFSIVRPKLSFNRRIKSLNNFSRDSIDIELVFYDNFSLNLFNILRSHFSNK